MTKYTLVYRKLEPNTDRFTGENFSHEFEGSSDELKEHVRKMWSQGCCNIWVTNRKKDTTPPKRSFTELKINANELRRINSILNIYTSVIDDPSLYAITQLPDIEAIYSVDCGNGFTAKINALRRMTEMNAVFADAQLYYKDMLVYRTGLTGLPEAAEAAIDFELGEEVIYVKIVPCHEEPKTVKFPKLLISMSVLDDENEEDENDDVYYEY